MIRSHKLHQSARALAPFVTVLSSMAGSILFVINIESAHPLVIIVSLLFSLGFTIFMGFLPGIVLRRIPVICPQCGGPSFADDKKRPELFKCSQCGSDYTSGFDTQDFFLGLFVTTIGMSFSLITPLAIKDVGLGSRLFFFFFGLIWVLMGLLVMGTLGKLNDRLAKRWPIFGRIPYGLILGITTTCGLGIVFMLVSEYDPRDDAFPSGRPAVFGAGLVFFLAGVAAIMPRLFGGNKKTKTQTFVSSLLVTTFLSVPVLISSNEISTPIIGSISIMGMISLVAWRAVIRQFIPDRRKRYAAYATILVGLIALIYITTKNPTEVGKSAGEVTVLESLSFVLCQRNVVAGGKFTIVFDKPVTWPEGYHYWVNVIDSSAGEGAYGKWQYLSPGVTELELVAPLKPGSYEVRLHSTLNTILYKLPLQITAEEPGISHTTESTDTPDILEIE